MSIPSTRLLMVAAMVVGSPVAALAAEPQKLWEAGGLKNPESAVYDPAAGAIYVSNVNSDPMVKDGNGFISKIGTDGKVIALEWVEGLDSPTGLAPANGVLYAADVDRVVAIDPAKAAIEARHEAPGAKFLNDLAADKQGRIYASDMPSNSIWALDGGNLDGIGRTARAAISSPTGRTACSSASPRTGKPRG